MCRRPLERNGDFSQSSIKPRDPLTGQPFPNNQIPRERIDPGIIKYMDALIPLPNASGGRHIYNAPITKDGWQVMGRLDTQLTDRQRLFGRMFYDKNELVNTNGLPILHSEVAYVTWNTAVNHTHILSPQLVNAFQFTYSETDLDRGPLPVGDSLNFQKLGVNVPLATEGHRGHTGAALSRRRHQSLEHEPGRVGTRRSACRAVQERHELHARQPRAEVRRRISVVGEQSDGGQLQRPLFQFQRPIYRDTLSATS